MSDFLDDVWKDVEPAFCKPELELMDSATKILIASIYRSNQAYETVTAKLFPTLLQANSHSLKLLVIVCKFWNPYPKVISHSGNIDLGTKNADQSIEILYSHC